MKSLKVTAPIQKQVEVAPTQVEVPATNTDPTKVDDQATPPSQFPGTKMPDAVEPEKAPPTDNPGNQPPVNQTKEPASAPSHGQ